MMNSAVQRSNCICFFHCAPLVGVNFLILILNLIFMASWANGLCTQGLFTSCVAMFGKSEQVDMALFPLFVLAIAHAFLAFLYTLRLLHLRRTGLIGKIGLPIAQSLPECFGFESWETLRT